MLDKVCLFSWQTNTLVRMENYFLALWYSNYSHFKTSTKNNVFLQSISSNIELTFIRKRYAPDSQRAIWSVNFSLPWFIKNIDSLQNISSYIIREVNSFHFYTPFDCKMIDIFLYLYLHISVVREFIFHNHAFVGSSFKTRQNKITKWIIDNIYGQIHFHNVFIEK